MKLTEHQTKVFNDLISSIDETLSFGQRAMFSLTGPAGCGKTVLTAELIKFLLNTYSYKYIKLTTPTHKSLGVAKKMLNKSTSNHTKFSTGTIHSHLKLKADTVEDRIVFVEDLMNKENQKTQFLLIDESSMISEEIFGHIKKLLSRGLVEIVVFIGDKVQLPPVDGNENPVYSEIKQFQLKEVVRQAMDNPLLKKATEIRIAIENFQEKDIPFDRKILDMRDYKSDSGIEIFKDHEKWLYSYIENNNDKTISAFTNNTVNIYNDFNRKMWLQSKNPPYLVNNDVVVLQSAFSNGTVSVSNGEVLTVDNPVMKVHDKLNLNYWEFDTEEKDENITINVLDPSSREKYDNLLQKISSAARKMKEESNHYGAKDMWEKFWKVKNTFVEIKYDYSHTIHKLQGSTYEDIYLNLNDVIANVRDDETLFRLVYVAFTRASNKISLLV